MCPTGQGRDQLGSTGHTVSLDVFLDFWRRTVRNFHDEAARFVHLLTVANPSQFSFFCFFFVLSNNFDRVVPGFLFVCLFFFGWIRLYRRSSALVGFSFSWTLVLLDYTVEYGYIIHGYSVQPLILAIFGRNRIFYIIKPSGYIIQPSGYIAATLRGARGEYLHRIWLFCTIQLALRG